MTKNNQKPNTKAWFLAFTLIGAAALGGAPEKAFGDDGEEGHDHYHAVRPIKPASAYAPTAMPDRIILTLSEDPRTTQSVNWRTSVEVETGLAEIAIATAGPKFRENAKRVRSTSQALKSDINTAHYHSVVFRELKPSTVYAYRVGDGTNWSEWFHFRTASESPEPFSFVYFGDAQNEVRSMWSRVIREAQREAPKAAFLLHAGDLINHAETDAEWGEWFGAGAWLNAMTPSIAIPGNHEHVKDADGVRRKLSHHWRNVFTFPENGPRGLEETCYTLTYHNIRIIGMNSNEMHEQQAVWLEKVLSENESQWVICTFHHPVFSTGKKRDNAGLRAIWKPIFDKYKVDLVLQGHDHTYGRTGFKVPSSDASASDFKAAGDTTVGDTNVATGVSKVDEDAGTVYVVSVSGPKMYENTRFDFMKRVGEDTQLYQIIHIDGAKLKFEARTALGKVYDAFELEKQEGKPNKLTDLEPEVPQNLRPR
ncbi:MAG: fibronectin type III domain-containing protein [Mariniblastus sp.]